MFSTILRRTRWRTDGEPASETAVAGRSSAHHGVQPRKAASFSFSGHTQRTIINYISFLCQCTQDIFQ